MGKLRTISDLEVRALKAATSDSYLQGGGVTGFEVFTRVTVSKLSEYASFDAQHHKRVIGIDVAVEADRRGRSPVIVKAMAGLLGYRLEPAGPGSDGGIAISERDAHRVLAEAMDVSRALLSAFDDGRIDALEKKRLRRELHELIAAAEETLAKLEVA